MTRSTRAGFVLLEAVVALAILGVASIVLLQVRSQQIRVAVQARELLTAQALAEDRLSALKLLDYPLLEDPPDSLMEGTFPPPFEAFSWTGAVELIEDEYDLFGVEVVVVGPAERFPLRTMVHRPRSLLMSGLGGPGGMMEGRGMGRGQGMMRGGQGGGARNGGAAGAERTGGNRGGSGTGGSPTGARDTAPGPGGTP